MGGHKFHIPTVFFFEGGMTTQKYPKHMSSKVLQLDKISYTSQLLQVCICNTHKIMLERRVANPDLCERSDTALYSRLNETLLYVQSFQLEIILKSLKIRLPTYCVTLKSAK